MSGIDETALSPANAGLRYKQPSRKVSFLLIGFMMLFAAIMGVIVFSKTSLRLDEAQSLFQTNRDIPGLLKTVAQDVHVPFYHILLHFWQKVFGASIEIARYMSLAFFLAVIPAVYWLGSYAFNRSAGLFAALLITISPFMNWYGAEARMYAMLAFITVLHQVFFLKVFREGKSSHWLGYTLTAIAGIYTHYFFTFVLITEVLFFLVMRKNFAPKKAFLKFVGVAAVVIAAFLPWLTYVYSLGTASNTRPNLGTPSSGDLFNTYTQFIFGFQADYLNTIIVSLWPIIVLLAFFALQKNRKVPPEAIFFVMAAVIPVFGAFIISLTLTPFYLSRYLIVALPALFIFMSWVFANYPRPLANVLRGLLIVAIAATFFIQVDNPDTPVKEDYAAATQYLNKNVTAQDVIIVSAPFTIYPIEYYYTGTAKPVTQPVWDRFSQGAIPAFNKDTLTEETKMLTNSYQRAWLVLSFDQGYESEIKKHYDNNFERIESKNFSPGLNVYTYKLRYDDTISIDPLTPAENP